MKKSPPEVLLIGRGATFDAIASANGGLAAERTLRIHELSSIDSAATEAASVLGVLDASVTSIFIAIDQQALNHARLDIYALMRLKGFKSETLIHPEASVDLAAKLGENCWVGPRSWLGHDVVVGNNSIIGAACRIEPRAKIAANCWLGSGAVVGQRADIGQHCVIGCDVNISADVCIGRHCSIDVAGHYNESLSDGTFIDPLFPMSVRIYGLGTSAVTP